MSTNGGADRFVGVVRWYDARKGYGFVKRDGEKDAFMHVSDVKAPPGPGEDLREGELVSYELKMGPKGMKAVNIRREVEVAPTT